MKGKIDCNKIARELEKDLSETEVIPKLRIVLAGTRESSKTFVREKLNAAERIGFEAELTHLPEDVGEDEFLDTIRGFNRNKEIDGVLVQLPLPDHIDENAVFEELAPEKDVDGLTPENLGKTLRGAESVKPAAVEGIIKILQEVGKELEGSKAVVVNDSALIGRPLSHVLSQKGATVTVCHKGTDNLKKELEDADIVVTATGNRKVTTVDMIPEGSVVIDGGYENGEGDLEADEISKKALVSKVPDGLGPLTVACTMKNLLRLYRKA